MPAADNAKAEVMTPEEQLQRWLAGDSVHNVQTDECTPDFSCCQPELQASIEERTAFCNDPDAVAHLSWLFLSRLVEPKA